MNRKKIIIANWKMYKTMAQTKAFLSELTNAVQNLNIKCDYGIAASFTNLALLQNYQAKNFMIIAQNCHYETQGPFTGEISLQMLQELKVNGVIIGHSERRMFFNETNEIINQKLIALLNANLIPILCCGENLSEYQSKKTQNVIQNQIKVALKNLPATQVAKIIIAYEPIWAIGTGISASPVDAQTVCAMIRDFISELYDSAIAQKIRIQYGGSVKPENIKNFLNQPDIDGALVGGASLQVKSFIGLLI